MTREEALEDSVKELGVRLSALTTGGVGNPKIAAELDRAREALRMEKSR
jgi:hypothetical protein